MYYIVISIILLIIFSIILLSIYNKKKKYLEKEYKQEYYNNNQQEFAKIREDFEREFEEHRERTQERYREYFKDKEQERRQIEQSLLERKQAVEEIIAELEKRKTEAENHYQELLANGQKNVEERIRIHEATLIADAAARITDEESKRRYQMEQELATFFSKCTEKQTQAQIELDEICRTLEDFKKKQQVINEEILRRRQVEEQQDFYRVVLDEAAISDMQILLTIREKLISHENLDKLIYDAYVAKPVLEMTKRVLGGRAPSGIYKITRLKTGEVYIGKSTDIKKRWTEHCKTAYGVGSIAHSILHTTIKRDGIENFTFELLEEVPKDKLTEREKYWITFYGSKEYGLNERIG